MDLPLRSTRWIYWVKSFLAVTKTNSGYGKVLRNDTCMSGRYPTPLTAPWAPIIRAINSWSASQDDWFTVFSSKLVFVLHLNALHVSNK